MKHLATVVVLVLIISLMSQAEADHHDKYSCKFPAIYVLGDSHSDTGGIPTVFTPLGHPYGETYFHRSTGRYSDGRLIIDFITEFLRMPFLSPYVNSLGSNFKHGANFASSGATIQRPVESWFSNHISPFPLDIQVAQFTQFKDRSTFLYRQVNADRSRLPNPKGFSKALYVVDIGQNDIAFSVRNNMSTQHFNAMLTNITKTFATQIRVMYSRGARFFWIHNTGPFGCMPYETVQVRDPAPGSLDKHGCINWQNERSLRFNALLKHSVAELRVSLSEAAITLVDIYRAKYELIGNARKYGFENPATICCGIYGKGVSVWCSYPKTLKNGTGLFAGSCDKPSAVISWDGVHYTEAANRWVAERIIHGEISDPPIPINRACHTHI